LFREALNYYYDFTKYVNPKQSSDTLKINILENLVENGDETIEVYEQRKNGQSLTEDQLRKNDNRYNKYRVGAQQGSSKNNKDQGEILEIDASTYIQLESQGNEKKEEDYGGIEIQETGEGNMNSTDGGGINWGDFEVLGQGNDAQQKVEGEFEVIEDGKDDVEIVEDDTILANFETRNQVLASLGELLFFLKQREYESEGVTTNSVLQAYEQVDHTNIFEVSREQINRMINFTQVLIDILNEFKARQYFILKD